MVSTAKMATSCIAETGQLRRCQSQLHKELVIQASQEILSWSVKFITQRGSISVTDDSL